MTDPQRVVDLYLRLKPAISKEVAEQQLHALFQHIAQMSPARFPKDGLTAELLNYLDSTAGREGMRSSLHLLFCAVGFLLVIACTNVAILQLARGSSRSREIAVRLALGASRARLIQLLLAESWLLSLLSGALGVFFAFVVTQIIIALMPYLSLPNEAIVTINGWVLAFSVSVSMLTGILVGLVPALRSTRPDINTALKDGGRASGGGRGTRTRNAMVVLEVALSIVLLVGASLTIRGFVELQRIDPGINPETIFLRIPLVEKRYTTLEQRTVFARNLLERVQSLPGVASAAIGWLPNWEAGSSVSIQGQPKQANAIAVNFVSADYFQTLGITLRTGRDFTAQETARGDHVALINESARKLWPNGDNPIGHIIQIDSLVSTDPDALTPAKATKEVTVIGIVADTRMN
jgi:predicted permease